MRCTLSNVADPLDPNFTRMHRSYIIRISNLIRIKSSISNARSWNDVVDPDQIKRSSLAVKTYFSNPKKLLLWSVRLFEMFEMQLGPHSFSSSMERAELFLRHDDVIWENHNLPNCQIMSFIKRENEGDLGLGNPD